MSDAQKSMSFYKTQLIFSIQAKNKKYIDHI